MNSRPHPYQGCALPLSYHSRLFPKGNPGRYPESGRVEDLVELIQKHSNDNNFLVSVSYVHKDDLISKLDENNINYTKAVMYRTVSNDFEEGEAFDYDMLIFFSPSGIVAMLKNFPNFVSLYSSGNRFPSISLLSVIVLNLYSVNIFSFFPGLFCLNIIVLPRFILTNIPIIIINGINTINAIRLNIKSNIRFMYFAYIMFSPFGFNGPIY